MLSRLLPASLLILDVIAINIIPFILR